jgi:hypothetical protein
MSLPDLLSFHGDWQRYEDELYEIYMDTLVRIPPMFRGLTVKTQYRPASKGKGYGFWHVISEGPVEEDRLPDIKRCARIRWIAWLISNAENNPMVSWWENQRGSSTHVVIWIESEDFAVILAKRNGYYLLKSAYWVKSGRKADFLRERAAFWNA